jgi:aldehyde dehydrogenase (NAD+)
MKIQDILETMDYGPSPESADQARAWLAKHEQRFDLYIGGQQVAGESHFDTTNPATGKPLAKIAQATAAQVQQAVDAAAKAQPGWAALGGHARARHLYALARALQKHSRLFAVIETMDNGKTIRETRDIDIPLAVRHFYHHAGWAQLLDSEYPNHRPLGVVGQIVPWNFPLLMLAWKIAPALACGNTVVFKPAEQTSLSALLFAEICVEAGLPPGVVNIVTGDGTVQQIVGHPGIAKIAFTGSTEVGRAIRKATAGTGKKLSLELGGKSPFIVFADADLDAAVEGLVDSIWFNQGQVCCAGSRLLVHEGTADRLVAKLKARMATIRLGDPLDKSTDMGSLVDRTQHARVSGFVDRARTAGAQVWQASATPVPEGEHCFYPPTLVTGVDTAFEIVQQEVFGPVLSVQSFRTPNEAVELANNTAYGLAACVWSESIGLALEVAPRLKAGVVWVNTANQFDAAAGFGGYRESGFGREGGREGLREYLAPPALTLAKPPAAAPSVTSSVDEDGGIDRTPKLYIGGKQVRPDSGYSRAVHVDGKLLGVVPEGNRKDIRNAVEAARGASAWERQSAHGRAQVLFYLAENLLAQGQRLVQCLQPLVGAEAAQREVDATVQRLFSYAAWADKYDGAVHPVPVHGVVLAMNEPIGVIGVIAPERHPLLGLVSLLAPAIAMGNRVVAVPSAQLPTVAAELYPLLDTSDVPAGVVNLVTGDPDTLADTLAAHADVDAVWWHCGPSERAKRIETLSATNLKRMWTTPSPERDWLAGAEAEGREFLEQSTQVKNIWVPYGV